MIGQRLQSRLKDKNHEVVLLSRTPDHKNNVFGWDLENNQLDESALKGVDYIMHLAGAGIADKPWTDSRKREIIDSRVKSIDVLHDHLSKSGHKLKGFISASAIGYYPLINNLPPQIETDDPGSGFLSEVCVKWEESADRMKDLSGFVSKVRIGLVLAKEGGALTKLIPPVKFFVGAPLASGQQAMPWIHMDDVCNIFIHIMEKNLEGIYNAVGPEYTKNENFLQTLADIMERPLLPVNVPEFVVKIVAGEMAELVLKGAPVSSKKIQKTGFHFEFPTLNTALSDIIVGSSF